MATPSTVECAHARCRKSPERWATVVGCAFSVLALLYTSIMLLGYSTFGDHCASNILRNYAQVP